MFIHIALLVIICAIAFIVYQGGVSKQKNKYFIIASGIPLFLVEALRAPCVGLDTKNYIWGFEILAHGYQNVLLSWTVYRWEPLWKALNYVIGYFTYNPQWLLSITSFIIVVGIGRFIYDNCDEHECAFWPMFFFMTLAFLYPFSMYLLRQFMALIILMQVYTFLKNEISRKKIILSCFFVVLAMGFHYIAIVGFIIIWVCMKKSLKRKDLVLFTVFAFLMPVVYPFLKQILIDYTPYASYFFGSAFGKGESLRAYLVFMALVRIIIFVLLYCTFKNKTNETNEIYVLGIFNSFALSFMLMQTQILMAQRLALVFDIFIILLIPKLFNRIKNSNILYISSFALGWCFYLFLLSLHVREIVPYYFFWQV